MPRFSILLIVAALQACSPTGDQPQAQPDPGNRDLLRDRVAEDCLLVVWSDQPERDADFDRAHDQVEGGAISCATGTSASQFEAAISALREAGRSGDKARVLDQLGLPLLYIDASGERREIRDRAAAEAVFDEVFDPAMLDTLAKLDLSQMAVDDKGGSFALGSLWLVVNENGGRPRLVTVNRQALDEATRTARDRAARNQGRPVPFDKP